MTISPPTTVLAAPTAAVDAFLAEILTERRRELRALDRELAALGEVVSDTVLSGGKRLRPAFLYWGYCAAGGTDTEVAIHAGAALELLHTYAILHDDVMDRSDTRRGLPSAHRRLEHHHRRRARHGDPEWFGVSAGVLAGDLVSVWADELIADLPIDAGTLRRVQKVYAELRREAIAGQYLDLWQPTDDADVLRTALLKTARYSITHPLVLGATLTGVAVPDATVGSLTTYGDSIGVAFQLRDDILGLFGDPADTGKSDADDLRQGKRTLLITRAERRATPTQRVVLSAALGNPDITPAEADDVRAIVAGCGALDDVERTVRAEHETAVRALDEAPAIDRDVADALCHLAALATVRVR